MLVKIRYHSQFMSSELYTIPVKQLFQQGDPDLIQDWSSYLALGITAKHIDELAKIAIDRSLLESEEESGWASIHAWRTLGVLSVAEGESAVLPLIAVLQQLSGDEQAVDFDEIPDFDWVSEELPLVFGHIGRMALPALQACLGDAHASNRTRENVVVSIAEIGRADGDLRLDCLTILTQQLEKFDDNTPDFNGFLVMVLVGTLRAVESAATIEQAFLADRVTSDLVQNWDEAQVFLGLKEAPDYRNQLSESLTSPLKPDNIKAIDQVPFYSTVPKSKAQAKRKTQNQSRKKNRPKK